MNLDADLSMEHWELIPIFFLISILYSTVGFGGGSSYLAVLALFGMAPGTLRTIALICNLAVVSGNLIVQYKAGTLALRRSFPMVLAAVPMAFLGGTILLDRDQFSLLLGSILIGVAILMFLPTPKQSQESTPPKNGWEFILLAMGLGFLAGLVGIGGGIFLAPVLYLLKWDRAYLIVSTASLFIFWNSAAGLLGAGIGGHIHIDWELTLALLAAVILGGQIGSRITIGYLSEKWLKPMTGILVCFIGMKLLYSGIYE